MDVKGEMVKAISDVLMKRCSDKEVYGVLSDIVERMSCNMGCEDGYDEDSGDCTNEKCELSYAFDMVNRLFRTYGE